MGLQELDTTARERTKHARLFNPKGAELNKLCPKVKNVTFGLEKTRDLALVRLMQTLSVAREKGWERKKRVMIRSLFTPTLGPTQGAPQRAM